MNLCWNTGGDTGVKMLLKLVVASIVLLCGAPAWVRGNLAPTSVKITQPSPTGFNVEFTPVQNAVSYSVYVEAFHDQTDNILIPTTSTNVSVNGRRSNIVYRVFVTAINGSTMSSNHTLARTAPNGVEVLSFITTPTFITIFLEQVPGVTAYQVEVTNANNPTETRIVAVPDDVVGSYYVSIVTDLQPNTNYSVRARASEIVGIFYSPTQSHYGPVKSVVTDMVSVFGTVELLSGTCNASLQVELLAAYRIFSTNVVDVIVLPALSSSLCQHEIILSDQTIPPNFESLNLEAFDPNLYSNSVVRFNASGNQTYGIIRTAANERGIAYTAASACSSFSMEDLSIYNKSGFVASGSIVGSDEVAQTIKILTLGNDLVSVSGGTFDIPLARGRIYAIHQNYLVETCSGAASSGVYDRLVSAEHPSTNTQDKYSILFTTEPPQLVVEQFDISLFSNASGLIIKFSSELLSRATNFNLELNGTTRVFTENMLDSSVQYKVEFGNLTSGKTYRFTIDATVRAADGTLQQTNSVIFITVAGIVCETGFTLNGTICQDTNECSNTSACNATYECRNSFGSYNCLCPSGFTDSGRECVDINECTLSTHNCTGNTSCFNVAGGFRCCENWTRWNGSRCVDNCAGVVCQTNAFCNAFNDGSCQCNDGFDNNTGICEDINECMTSTNPCGNGTCNNTVGNYTCNCDAGFMQQGGTCVAACTNCHPNAYCVGPDTCQCNSGFTGDGTACTALCGSSDVCGANTSCYAVEDTPQCGCNVGHVGNEVTCLPCVGSLIACSPNATCNETKKVCVCNPGFSGVNGNCVDVNECDLNSGRCDDNASCDNVIGSYQCTCNEGYTGNGVACNLVCGTQICHANATCEVLNGTMTCECIPGHVGDGLSCEECVGDMQTCYPNATCNETTKVCVCNPGFSKINGICVDVNECELDPRICHDKASCDNVIGIYQCTCNEGYTGDGVTCNLVCGTQICHANATCELLNDTVTCQCIQGHVGDGLSCEECVGDMQTCYPNANCTDVDGNVTCTCKTGFTGTYGNCFDMDECLCNGTCHANATCHNTPGSYTCTCDTDFTGDGRTCHPLPPACGTRARNCLCGEVTCAHQDFCSHDTLTCSCPTMDFMKSNYSITMEQCSVNRGACLCQVQIMGVCASSDVTCCFNCERDVITCDKLGDVTVTVAKRPDCDCIVGGGTNLAAIIVPIVVIALLLLVVLILCLCARSKTRCGAQKTT